MNFVFFGVKKSGTSVFLVSAENGAGVKKMTNIMPCRYVPGPVDISGWQRRQKYRVQNVVCFSQKFAKDFAVTRHLPFSM